MADRVILHCDLNNFFASVECLDHPELREKPMAVGGSEQERHGIILAKNEAAKQFQVKTAEPIWQAKRKCPELVVLPPHYEAYVEYSKRAQEIYNRFTDQIEPFGIDECWLDVTGSQRLFGTGIEMGNQLRELMKSELHLTISVGVSFNKTFAKLGSDLKKPDGITVISRFSFHRQIWPLPCETLLGIGKATQKQLFKLGIKTIGDLAQCDPAALHRLLGKQGDCLHRYANGRDTSPVLPAAAQPAIKSIGRSATCRIDLTQLEQIHRVLLALAEKVSAQMRREGVLGKLVQVQFRDSNLHTEEHQQPLSSPTRLASTLAHTATRLLAQTWDGRPLRSVGIRACTLVPETEPAQLSFYENPKQLEQLETLEEKMDFLRQKHGNRALMRASLMQGLPFQSERDRPAFARDQLCK